MVINKKFNKKEVNHCSIYRILLFFSCSTPLYLNISEGKD